MLPVTIASTSPDWRSRGSSFTLPTITAVNENPFVFAKSRKDPFLLFPSTIPTFIPFQWA